MKSILLSIAVTGLLCLPFSAMAQAPATSSPQKEAPQIPVVKIVLHPMAEPRPALKYQLLPALIDRKSGNAAVLYNRIPAEKTTIFSNSELIEKIDNLRSAPLADLRQESIRNLIPNDVVRDIIRAAHSEYCDWQLPIREEPFWQILLPDVQQTRHYGRFLAAKARIQIAEGKYDEAILTIQAGFGLARHVAAGQTVIHGLIGKAIVEVMHDQLRELIQQSDAPSLYWALRTLPRPVINFRPGLEAEYDALYMSYPKLRNLEKELLSVEESRKLLEETLETWIVMFKNYGIAAYFPSTRLETATVLLADFPASKKSLIERGMSPEKVEAMPVAQVVLLSILRHYDEARDDCVKWLFSPNAESNAGFMHYEKQLNEDLRKSKISFSLEGLMLPGIGQIISVTLLNERDLAALEVLEALRIHAAAHDGRLPEKLEDIAEVPVPLDPLWEKPFIYRCQGNTATLESSNPPNRSVEGNYLKYEIQMLPKGK